MKDSSMAPEIGEAYGFMTGADVPRGRNYLLRRTSEIAPEQVTWLWTGRVPAGTVTVLDGDPGKGKSTLTAALAAAVSTGRPLPGDTRMRRGGVIFISLEDDPAMVIVPRLVAAGADRERIHIPEIIEYGAGRLPILPQDLPRIQQMIYESEARLVIVDPLMAALSGDVNGNQDQDVRRVLAELSRIAGATGAAVVLVRHLNKSAGRVAIYRGGGSIGIIGAARSGLLLTAHPADPAQLLLTVSKSNLGVRPRALALRIVQAANGFGTIEWGEEAEISADDALTGLPDDEDQEPDGELGAAIAWLREALATGPLPSKQVLAEATENGFSRSTVKRAKIEAGIQSRKFHEPEPHWQWSIAPEVDQGPQRDTVSRTNESLGSLGSLAPTAPIASERAIYKESSSMPDSARVARSVPPDTDLPDQGDQEDQGTQQFTDRVGLESLALPGEDVGQGVDLAAPPEDGVQVADPADPEPKTEHREPTTAMWHCCGCGTPIPAGDHRRPPCRESWEYIEQQLAARAEQMRR